MREKNIKLIMELIFIFILPLLIMSFSTTLYQENELNFNDNGNNDIIGIYKKLQFDNSFVNYYNDKMYINKLNFNQLLNIPNKVENNSYELLINNGLINLNGSSSVDRIFNLFSFPMYKNHKYLLTNFNVVMPISSINNNSISLTDSIGNTFMSIKENSTLNYVFGSVGSDINAIFKLHINTGVNYSIEFYPQLYDLTQMFGSGKEPTTIDEFKQYVNVNEYHTFTESQIINYESNKIISTNFEYNYSIWGKIKQLLIDNLKINNSIVLDFVICYTMLWFIMFVIWHFFYLFFDGLVHLFVDLKKRSE